MYSFLWHIMPGPKYIKVLELLVLLGIVLLGLFQWGYPWANEYFHLTGNTVQ